VYPRREIFLLRNSGRGKKDGGSRESFSTGGKKECRGPMEKQSSKALECDCVGKETKKTANFKSLRKREKKFAIPKTPTWKEKKTIPQNPSSLIRSLDYHIVEGKLNKGVHLVLKGEKGGTPSAKKRKVPEQARGTKKKKKKKGTLFTSKGLWHVSKRRTLYRATTVRGGGGPTNPTRRSGEGQNRRRTRNF